MHWCNKFYSLVGLLLLGLIGTSLHAQEIEPGDSPSTGNQVAERTQQAVDQAGKSIERIANQVDESAQAQEVSAGLLQPIYALAETLEFPAFHWLAFMFMVAGTIGFALQLVLGKLVVLTKSGFSPTEIISDAVGLIVSAVGLVLTTQAAAQNSTFTASPFAVLSSAAIGLLLGILLYIWGQRQELEAVRARSILAKSEARERAEKT